jgi:hypothetical protein
MNNLQDLIHAACAAFPTNRKKQIEIQYLAEAHRASSVFPIGELVPSEIPDFLLRTDGRIIGIEVTELCREQQRAEGGKLSRVSDKAREIYERLATANPIDVSAAFAPNTENVRFGELTKGLAAFAHANRSANGTSFDWNDFDLPGGYCYIAIDPARESIGQWRTSKAFGSTLVTKEPLERCIADKNLRLPDYRLAAGEVWLLIVNDQFLGAGEVYARPDHLAQWKFAYGFEKVLLFSREPGGGGQVIELQRANGVNLPESALIRPISARYSARPRLRAS